MQYVPSAQSKPGQKKASWNKRLDQYLLNPYTGFPVMLLFFSLLFALSFLLGKPVSTWLGLQLDQIAMIFEASRLAATTPPLLVDMISSGIFRGIGSALAFFPQMLIFYFFYTLMTETGYISRIAYLMQDPMDRLNMDANSFTCLILGYSCNVPAVLSTRSIQRRIDRLILMLLSTFTPCSARFGVILYIAAAFFSPLQATLVMSGLFVLSLVVKAAVAYIIKKRLAKPEEMGIEITLPPLHLPNMRNVSHAALMRTLDFLNRIKNVVIISSVVIWFLSSFPLGKGFDYSYAATLGRFLEPLGQLAGLNWQLIVALFLGFFAKETTLSTLGVLYHASEGLGNLSSILASQISPLAGLTFLVMFMFYTPCLATVTAIRQESQSLSFAALSVIISLLLAFILGILIFQFGSLFMH